MKIKESPSIILAFHGMLGRKKQTSLLLLLLTLVFSFLTAAVIYSVSSAQVLQDTRCELYGEWQYLRLSDTAADAAQAQNTLPASAQVSTVIQNGIVLGADDGVAGGPRTIPFWMTVLTCGCGQGVLCLCSVRSSIRQTQILPRAV